MTSSKTSQLTLKQLVFDKRSKCRYDKKKVETLLSTDDNKNGNINRTGLSGRANGLKLQAIIRVGISECACWLFRFSCAGDFIIFQN